MNNLQNKEISAIVPFYNEEKFIDQSISRLIDTNLFKKIGGSVPQNDDYEKVKTIKDFSSKGIDMHELMNTEIPPLKYAIRPILPEGFVCIAGRPKAMKSWTMLKIAYAVQNGKDFMVGQKTIKLKK